MGIVVRGKGAYTVSNFSYNTIANNTIIELQLNSILMAIDLCISPCSLINTNTGSNPCSHCVTITMIVESVLFDNRTYI